MNFNEYEAMQRSRHAIASESPKWQSPERQDVIEQRQRIENTVKRRADQFQSPAQAKKPSPIRNVDSQPHHPHQSHYKKGMKKSSSQEDIYRQKQDLDTDGTSQLIFYSQAPLKYPQLPEITSSMKNFKTKGNVSVRRFTWQALAESPGCMS